MSDAAIGLLIPLLGTSLGALCVVFMRGGCRGCAEGLLSGFAAGVMTAASVWSLLEPALERSAENLGRLAALPPSAGFIIGVGGLMALDRLLPQSAEGEQLPRRTMMLAVTLHNVPEGMAVGAVYAGVLCGVVSPSAALVLSLGIAVQNFPEGAIISMPLCAAGMSGRRAFLCGVLSGIVEPLGGALTIAAAGLIVPALPVMLGFAAGAMIYVVVGELIPECVGCGRPCAGIGVFAAGFLTMMILDVTLG